MYPKTFDDLIYEFPYKEEVVWGEKIKTYKYTHSEGYSIDLDGFVVDETGKRYYIDEKTQKEVLYGKATRLLPEYDKIGQTYYEVGRDGNRKQKIRDWTKRNDHRHHAMDALTIAFTRRQFIQYLNHLNARIDALDKEGIDLRDYNLDDVSFGDINPRDRYGVVKALQDKYLYFNLIFTFTIGLFLVSAGLYL